MDFRDNLYKPPYNSHHRKGVRRHSSTAVESGVEKMEHVAQVILSYFLLLAPSISKHLALTFELGPGSRYNGVDMAEDFSSSILTYHIIFFQLIQQEDNELGNKEETSQNLN